MGATRKEEKAKLLPKFFSMPKSEEGSHTESTAADIKLPVGGELMPYKTGYIIFDNKQPEDFFSYTLNPKKMPKRFYVPKFKCENTLYTAANVSDNQILLGTNLGKIVVLEIAKKDINHPYNKPYDRAVERSAHKSQISAIASLPEQKLTATAAIDGSLYLWDEKRLCSFFSTDLEFRAVLASGEAEKIPSPEADEKNIGFIQLPQISALPNKEIPPPKYLKLTFTKSGELAGVMSDGTVHYFSAEKIALAFKGHTIKPDVLPFKVLHKHLSYFYIIGNTVFTPSYTQNIFNPTSNTASYVIDTAITRYDLREQTLKQIEGEKLESFSMIAGDFLICREDSSSVLITQELTVSKNPVEAKYNSIIKIDDTYYGIETKSDRNTPPYSKFEPINVENFSCVELERAFVFGRG